MAEDIGEDAETEMLRIQSQSWIDIWLFAIQQGMKTKDDRTAVQDLEAFILEGVTAKQKLQQFLAGH